ncbi:hypothetical protein [Paenarthrobacter aurescens]|uniref:hypothetical protein n=1 Tax=Paenarthrobacter aurescens TaxID=43663 RepID=UPI0021BE9DFD|nr:hypothetical protein [Paenarthrobacter aurescens]MCT9868085.1 hypothetical protein [Paenarthrobacter aurescens]
MKCQSRSHLVGLALAPVLMLGLSACLPPSSDGPAPGPAPSSPSTGTTAQPLPTAVVPTAEQPAGPAGPGAPQVDAPVVRWVPIGPIGPNDPTSGQRYLLLQQFQCDALAQSVEGADDAAVWLAGAAVCRALQSGSQQDWQRASIAVAATPRIPQTQCLEFRVAATSESLVAQHRGNPGAVFKVEPGQGEACPRQLVGLTVVDEQLRPVPGTARASGPRTGGTIVRLDGYYVRVGDVLFDGVPADVEFVGDRNDYGTIYLRMPPANGRDSVRISITDTVDVAGTVTFFYDDSSPSTSSPAPSETTGTVPGTGSPTSTPSATPPSGEATPTAAP